MQIIRRVLGLLWLILSTGLYAGDEFGGGHVVVCKNSEGALQSVRLLDYYEAKWFGTPEPLVVDMGDSTDPMTMALHAVNRLEKVDASRAHRYQSEVSHFFDNVNMVSGEKLPHTNDHQYVPLEGDCVIEQLATQMEPLFPLERPFKVQSEWWDLLSPKAELSKAGLILHEIIYREARRLGHKDSKASRRFNALISSSYMEDLNGAEYAKLVNPLGFGNPQDNIAPYWIADPIVLPAAMMGALFSQELATSAVHPTGEILRFSKVSGPDWLLVTENGSVKGTPWQSDIGINRFIVQATTLKGLSARATLQIEVLQFPGSEVFALLDPIELGVVYQGDLFQIHLGKFLIAGPSSEITVYSAQGLPAWLSMDSAGRLSGRPSKSDVGSYQFQLFVKRGDKGASAMVKGTVLAGQDAPHWIQDPIYLPDAFEDYAYSSDLSSSVANPDEWEIAFEIISGPSWLQISNKGVLSGTPSITDVGTQAFKVRFETKYGGFSDTATVKVNVQHVNHKPAWTQDPIVIEIHPGQPIVFDLLVFAKDPDGDVLMLGFKEEMPSWLTVNASNGMLSGRPPLDAQTTSAMFSVDDGQLSSDVTVIFQRQ